MLVALSCLTLYNPVDCNPPGSSVHEISRQEYWSGLAFPSSGDLSDPGIEPESFALKADSLSSEPLGKLVVGYLISGSRICPLVGS